MKLTRNERGFTLIELMVVLIIIGILAAIAIPIMSKQTDKANNKRAVAELKGVKTALDVYINDPISNTSGLPLADTTAFAAFTAANGITQFLDPWGTKKYQYLVSGTHYTIASFGKDGTANTDDDIFATDTANPKENTAVVLTSSFDFQ